MTDNSEISVTNIPSETGRSWEVALPFVHSLAHSEIERSQKNFVLAASIILTDLSLAPKETLDEALINSFRNGVGSKLFVGQPYELLYREYMNQESFDSMDRAKLMQPVPPYAFKVKEYQETCWFDGPGPRYSKEESEGWLKNRYTVFILPIRQTLRRLEADNAFIAVVQRLRADGWLDWHILNAIHGVTLNYRVGLGLEVSQSCEGFSRRFNELMRRDEGPDDEPVPLTLFTEEKMREQLRLSMLSTLKVMGLVCRQQVPDFVAIEHFLRHRYSYWKDDIEHEDLFRGEA